MHVSHLSLHDFRSYPEAEVELGPGATAFIGRNGQGKTNLVEAIDYIAKLGSHRVAGDAPLVRAGADHAVVRAVVVRAGREALLEVQINPGRSNKARVNRSSLPRARELLGLVRTGDMIEIDVPGRRLHLDVPDDELARRRESWRPKPVAARGYTKMFASHISQAPEGCDFDFLLGNEAMEEPEIH